MRSLFLPILILAVFFFPTASMANAPAAGQPAPDFTVKDSDGQTRSLTDFKGKYVVLEWVNFDCPFVRAHYESGSMPKLQNTYRDRGVAWLTICSSAPGNQGYFEGDELQSRVERAKASPTAYLVDAEGTVGKLYAAKSTPTMYVIDPQGTVIYAGGIDDTPNTNPEAIAGARNYVREALDLALEGKPVEVSSSKAYGCSVKY